MDMKNNGLQLNLFDEEETDSAIPEKQYDHTPLFERLAQSAFRSKFRLSAKDKAYIQEKGMATIPSHAQDFVFHCFPRKREKHLQKLCKCLIIKVDQPKLEPGTSRL